MRSRIRKATLHVNQNEGLIFEKSSAGKAAWKLPPLDVPEVDTSMLLGSSERNDLGNMPEVSEIEIIRHSRGFPRGITQSIWVCTHWARAR
jgi:glycine dehydrogenase subunit 2